MACGLEHTAAAEVGGDVEAEDEDEEAEDEAEGQDNEGRLVLGRGRQIVVGEVSIGGITFGGFEVQGLLLALGLGVHD